MTQISGFLLYWNYIQSGEAPKPLSGILECLQEDPPRCSYASSRLRAPRQVRLIENQVKRASARCTISSSLLGVRMSLGTEPRQRHIHPAHTIGRRYTSESPINRPSPVKRWQNKCVRQLKSRSGICARALSVTEKARMHARRSMQQPPLAV